MDEWTTWEVCLREEDEDGPARLSFSDAVVCDKGGRSAGDSPGMLIRSMVLLEERGFPPSGVRVNYEAADDEKPRVWYLRSHPKCWRAWFYVDHDNQRLIYLHAVCKKKQKRDARDTARAREVLRAYLDGRGRLARFQFPAL